MEPDTQEDSGYYGIWPSLVGMVLAAGLVALMFGLATGMH
jgi:hypothetical protein